MKIYNWNKMPRDLEVLMLEVENKGIIKSWDWDTSKNGKSQYITIFYDFDEETESELSIRFSDHKKTTHESAFCGFNLGRDGKNWKVGEAAENLAKILDLLASKDKKRWQYLDERDL